MNRVWNVGVGSHRREKVWCDIIAVSEPCGVGGGDMFVMERMSVYPVQYLKDEMDKIRYENS